MKLFLKKIVFYVFILFSFAFFSCSGSSGGNNLTAAFIFPGNIKTDDYCIAHNLGRISLEKHNIHTMYAENVPIDENCSLIIEEFIKLGCNLIYSCANQYEPYVRKMAEKYPNIKFAQYGFYKTAPNLETFCADTSGAFYLCGIVAAQKSYSGRIGYVAPFLSEDVVLGVNAFALGVLSVNPNAIIDIAWTKDWNNRKKERLCAEFLLNNGCDILSYYIDTDEVLRTASDHKTFCVAFNIPSPSYISRKEIDAYLTSVVINWSDFYLTDALSAKNGTWKTRNFCAGIESNFATLDKLTRSCSDEMKAYVENVKEDLVNGRINVFEGPIYSNKNELLVETEKTVSALEPKLRKSLVHGIYELEVNFN